MYTYTYTFPCVLFIKFSKAVEIFSVELMFVGLSA